MLVWTMIHFHQLSHSPARLVQDIYAHFSAIRPCLPFLKSQEKPPLQLELLTASSLLSGHFLCMSFSHTNPLTWHGLLISFLPTLSQNTPQKLDLINLSSQTPMLIILPKIIWQLTKVSFIKK